MSFFGKGFEDRWILAAVKLLWRKVRFPISCFWVYRASQSPSWQIHRKRRCWPPHCQSLCCPHGACDRRSPRSPAQPNALRRRPRPGRHLCLQQRSTGRRTNSNTRDPDDRSRPVHCVRRRTATSAAGPFCAEQRTAVSPFRCSQPAAEVTSAPAARAAPHPPRAATHPPEGMSPRATAGRSR